MDRPPSAASDLMAGMVLGAALSSKAALAALQGLTMDDFASHQAKVLWRLLAAAKGDADRVDAAKVREALGLAAAAGSVMDQVRERVAAGGRRRVMWHQAKTLQAALHSGDETAIAKIMEKMKGESK